MLLLFAYAHAADPEFVGTAAAGQQFKTPETHLAAELGGTFAGGNTRSYQLSASVDADHRWARNQVTLDTGGNLGRSMIDADGNGHLDDGELDTGWAETARKAWLDLRYDRFVGARDSLYLLAGGLIDPFSGYDDRVHSQAGYSRLLLVTKRTRLVAELGMDGAREDFVAGVTPNTDWILAVRGMGGLTHTLTDTVTFTDKLEVFESVLDPVDLRVLHEASLTTKVSDRFSLKLLHKVTFDNQPVEGFLKLDQTAAVTFVASLAPPKPAATNPCAPTK